MKTLPARPSLEHLKTQAKDLLDAAKAGDSAAVARFRAALPNVPPELALHDAQSAIAREYGFESWAKLRDRVLETPSEAALRSLMSSPMASALPRELLEATANAAEPLPDAHTLPGSLPCLALRNAIVARSTAAPLNVRRPQSIAAVTAAESGDRLIAVFAQRDESTEDPTLADLHPIGCAARVVRVVAQPDDEGTWVVVYGLGWIRLTAVDGEQRADRAVRDRRRRAGEHRDLRARIVAAVSKLPDPGGLLRQIDRMSALVLADAAVANAPCPVDVKAAYAGLASLSARVDRAIALIGG